MAATDDENGLILAIKDSIRQLWIIVLHPSGTLFPFSMVALKFAYPWLFSKPLKGSLLDEISSKPVPESTLCGMGFCKH
jgi:hypothetical protein